MINILMIDDDLDDQYFYRDLFKELSPELIFNGVSSKDELDKLLVYANKHVFDLPNLILLDLNFPKISGKEIYKALVVNARLKSVPIVALTTSSSPLDMKDCRDLGISAYFIKPSEFKDCRKLVETIHSYWFDFNMINKY